MFRGRRWKGSFGSVKGQNAGVVKLAVLLSLAVFLVFLIFTVGVQQTKAADCDCGFCHGDNHHGDGWTGCSGCHDSPPQTGTHLVHYNSPPLISLRYSDTTVSSTAEAYKFGCGNCHPLDIAKHRDGTLQVELYNPAAPSDSVKAKNPSTAAYAAGSNVTTYASKLVGKPNFSYSDGTCSNVYCHSGFTVVSGTAVSLPLTSPPSTVPPGYKLNLGFIMDETCSNVTYDPYTVTTGRIYQTTPAWGTNSTATATTFTTCKECHEFPLTTWDSNAPAGVGDSHQWVTWNQLWGEWYNWRHAYNYGNPMQCRTCHYSTVTQTGAFSGVEVTETPNGIPAWIVEYSPVPLASRIMHVNGTPDVAIDTVNGSYRAYYGTDNLSAATYEPATKTCSNVSCHQYQTKVKWGYPNRMEEGISSQECDVCHRTGFLNRTCTTP